MRPLIVLAMAGSTVWSVIAWVQGGSGLLALVAVVVLGNVVNAGARRPGSLAYRREWDSLASPSSRQSARRAKAVMAVLLALLMLLVGSALYYPGSTIGQPGDAAAMVGIMGAALVTLILTGIVAVIRAIMRAVARRRARDAVQAPVRVCVNGPLLPVPSLADAYRALPSYCWRILS